MTIKSNHKFGTGPYVTIIDRRRRMTDDTWMLIAIMLDEEGLTWRQMADALNRDPEDFRAQMREGIKAGKLKEARERLLSWGGVYARRMEASA